MKLRNLGAHLPILSTDSGITLLLCARIRVSTSSRKPDIALSSISCARSRSNQKSISHQRSSSRIAANSQGGLAPCHEKWSIDTAAELWNRVYSAKQRAQRNQRILTEKHSCPQLGSPPQFRA